MTAEPVCERRGGKRSERHKSLEKGKRAGKWKKKASNVLAQKMEKKRAKSLENRKMLALIKCKHFAAGKWNICPLLS